MFNDLKVFLLSLCYYVKLLYMLKFMKDIISEERLYCVYAMFVCKPLVIFLSTKFNYYVHIKSKRQPCRKGCMVEWSWPLRKRSVLSLATWATENELEKSPRDGVAEDNITLVYVWEWFMFSEKEMCIYGL